MTYDYNSASELINNFPKQETFNVSDLMRIHANIADIVQKAYETIETAWNDVSNYDNIDELKNIGRHMVEISDTIKQDFNLAHKAKLEGYATIKVLPRFADRCIMVLNTVNETYQRLGALSKSVIPDDFLIALADINKVENFAIEAAKTVAETAKKIVESPGLMIGFGLLGIGVFWLLFKR